MYEIEKVDMRVKYTREWTFEAFVSLLEHKELSTIKITDIINKAGISRATFYRNFSSKEDIVKMKVQAFFDSFYQELLIDTGKRFMDDEVMFVYEFFKRVNEEEKLVDTVIKCNLEYVMVEGILNMIDLFSTLFYQLVKTSKVSEKYTMEIVASSAWSLLSRWHKTGKKESPSRLAKIYTNAFKNIYLALYDDKSLIGD